MYTLSDFVRGIRDPDVAAVELNKLYHSVRTRTDHNPGGIDIFDRDWDNLVILDACRYDIFHEISGLPGSLRQVKSKASATKQFVTANFRGKKLHDTVYVSANGWYLSLQDEIDAEIHDFVPLHTSTFRENRYKTTLPESVTKAALDSNEQYPNKRLIVHYVQPHRPFIGPTGDKYFSEQRGLNFQRAVHSLDKTDRRKISRQAYRENLEIVLEDVQKLLAELNGKTVVTADHGELLGERLRPIPVRGYGHPLGIYHDSLIKVPWLVNDSEERKQIISEPPSRESNRSVTPEETMEHLKDLGYAV
ncbi:hypothetical protein [Haloarchaeobius sp. HRN-SO-5]|uniref:hypothetical protein n=1 Tax=Haloarchaeobius sp. HRN-SO-5 TaxID=3446118 RepID=UPI003EB7408C